MYSYAFCKVAMPGGLRKAFTLVCLLFKPGTALSCRRPKLRGRGCDGGGAVTPASGQALKRLSLCLQQDCSTGTLPRTARLCVVTVKPVG